MRFALVFLALAAQVFGAVDGTVLNKTTGQPQSGVKVTLTKLGEGGMQPGGSATTDAQGKFHIETDASSAHLLQAVWQGVSYNLSLQPGAPTSGVELAIYNALPRLSAVEVAQHMILLETNGQELVVSETVIYQNDSQTTWSNPAEGTVRISVPKGVSDIRSRVIAPGGLPIERPVKQGAGFVTIDYPVKPGETRFDFSYRMAATAPITFAGRIFHDPTNVRFVIPRGISVESTDLNALGNEPKTQATIYSLKTDTYKLALSGSGELAPMTEEQPTAADDAPRITSIAPPGYDRAWKWALGLTLAFLALGFWAQYIRTARVASEAAVGGKRKA